MVTIKKIHGTTTKSVKNWNRSRFLPNRPENLEQLDLLLLNVAKARESPFRCNSLFFDACIEYKYIGIFYALSGVEKTLFSRYYSDWYFIYSQINYSLPKLFSIDMHLSTAKSNCKFQQSKENEYKYPLTKSFEDIDLLIIDEIDCLKLQLLGEVRQLYDQYNFAVVLIGMPSGEKKTSSVSEILFKNSL